MWSLYRKSVWFLVSILAFGITLNAQKKEDAGEEKRSAPRKYDFGATVDVVGGTTNRLAGVSPVGTANSAAGNQSLFLFYGAYPTFTFDSTAGHSIINATYSYGLNQTRSAQNLSHNSHSASVRLSRQLNPDWKIDASESFESTSDGA